MSWIEDGDKEKPGLRISETLIHHYQKSQFINCIGVEAAPPFRPKPNEEEKTVIETPEKLKGLRMKERPDAQIFSK
jgi:hypothetical protein